MKMMIYIRSIKIVLFFLCVLHVNAQEILTKKEALEIALENNYGVQIANNNVEVAKKQLEYL